MNTRPLTEIRLLSWNVRGLNDPRKGRLVLQYLRRYKVDIVFLQETHLSPGSGDTFAASWGSHRYFAKYSSYSRGVVTLIHKKLPFQHYATVLDAQGRYVVVHGSLAGHEVLLLNIYAPNTDDPGFFTEIRALIDLLPCDALLWGGDFNLLLEASLDSTAVRPANKPLSLQILRDTCSDHALTDSWRIMRAECPAYTHYSAPHDTWSCLDYVLVTPRSASWLRSVSHPPRTLSDHAPVLVQLSIPVAGEVERRWRFPNRALLDVVFRDSLQTAMTEIFEINVGSVKSAATLWEAFKACTRGVCISQHAGILRVLRHTIANIEKELQHLDKLAVEPCGSPQLGRRAQLMQEFREAADREHKYISKFARARRYGEGERPGRILADLLLPPGSSTYITEVRDTEGGKSGWVGEGACGVS